MTVKRRIIRAGGWGLAKRIVKPIPILGSVVYLPAKFRLRVLPPVTFDVPPDQERYSKSRVMDEAEDIRVRLQETLYEMLQARKSVWFG